MRPSLDAWSILGYASLLLTLLLSGPGVKVVRADDPLVSTVPVTSEGPICSAEQTIDDEAFNRIIEEVRRDAAAAQPSGPDAPVALNNRGYNYGPPSEAALAALRSQLGIVMQEQRR